MTKTARNTNTARNFKNAGANDPKFAYTEVMKCTGFGLADGRSKAFVINPSAETVEDILSAIRSKMMALVKKHGVKGSTKIARQHAEASEDVKTDVKVNAKAEPSLAKQLKTAKAELKVLEEKHKGRRGNREVNAKLAEIEKLEKRINRAKAKAETAEPVIAEPKHTKSEVALTAARRELRAVKAKLKTTPTSRKAKARAEELTAEIKRLKARIAKAAAK